MQKLENCTATDAETESETNKSKNPGPVSVWQRLATISGDPLMKAKAERPWRSTATTLILCRAEEKGNLWTMAMASLAP